MYGQAPGNVRAAAFGSEHTLFSAGDGGTIYIWDLRMRRSRSPTENRACVDRRVVFIGAQSL